MPIETEVKHALLSTVVVPDQYALAPVPADHMTNGYRPEAFAGVLLTKDQIAQQMENFGRAFFDLYRQSAGGNQVDVQVVWIEESGHDFYSQLFSSSQYAISSQLHSIHPAHEETLPAFTGQHVLVLDDLLRTGKTMEKAIKIIKAGNPASIHCVPFLEERHPKQRLSFADDTLYTPMFSIPAGLPIVGQGFSYEGKFDALPDIYVRK